MNIITVMLTDNYHAERVLVVTVVLLFSKGFKSGLFRSLLQDLFFVWGDILAHIKVFEIVRPLKINLN